jgi:uncharacterized membrane protein YdjX (TVP38/TMEM64 family)
MKILKKWAPLSLIIMTLILFYAFDLKSYFSFSMLQTTHQTLTHTVAQHLFLSLILFAVAYVLVAATSLPIAVFLSILGGFLFGPFVSLFVVVISATIGATLLFLSIKTTFGEALQKNATSWVSKMEAGFKQNAFSYLLSLRLVPLFPFWAVTIVAALLNVPLRIFFVATLIGIIPGTFVYALVGNGLGVLLSQGKAPDLSIIFKPEIFLPLCGLALLSLLPILYKKRKKRE